MVYKVRGGWGEIYARREWRGRVERDLLQSTHISLWEHSSHFRLIGRGRPVSLSCPQLVYDSGGDGGREGRSRAGSCGFAGMQPPAMNAFAAAHPASSGNSLSRGSRGDKSSNAYASRHQAAEQRRRTRINDRQAQHLPTPWFTGCTPLPACAGAHQREGQGICLLLANLCTGHLVIRLYIENGMGQRGRERILSDWQHRGEHVPGSADMPV